MAVWLRSHPKDWGKDTLDRVTLHAEARALVQHPKFIVARQSFAQTMGVALAGQWVLHKVLRGDAQFALLACILHLHHRRNPAVPESGVTAQRILELFASGASHGSESVLASPTRIKSMLALTRFTKGLQLVPVSQDGRVDGRYRPLAPTARLIEPGCCWLRNYLQAVNLVLPLPEAVLEVPQPLLAEIMSYNVLAYTRAGFTLHQGYTEIQTCMSREAGHQILMRMVASIQTHADGRVFGKMPFQEVSDLMKVSRASVRNVIGDLVNADLIETTRGGHCIAMSPRFIDLCNEWIALELTWMYGLTCLAWRSVQGLVSL